MTKTLAFQLQHQYFQRVFKVDFPLDWLVWSSCFPRDSLRSLLQHHISKASILQHSTFFMVQLSQPYMTTGKTIFLTIWIFVSRVMSLLFNILSRFVITLLPRRSRLLISRLQSLSTVILEPKKRKSVTASTFSPFYLPWSDGTGCHDLRFFNTSFKPSLSLSSFTLIKRLFSSSSLSAIRVAVFA